MRKKFKVVGLDRKSCYARGKFCKTYNKDEIIAAASETLGIMTFDSRSKAQDFMHGRRSRCEEILEVTPIGRGKRPKELSSITSERFIEEFYRDSLLNSTGRIPRGTMCYPAVMVLE